MTETLAVIDYGSGNIRSAAKAFDHMAREEGLDVAVKITDKAEEIAAADRIVLPGQGAFGDCMQGLSQLPGMRDALEEQVIQKGKPFCGICVGMQLMANKGLEHGEHEGLGWVAGAVVPLQLQDPALKIPHMGWNNVAVTENGQIHPVLQSITKSSDLDAPDFYFVHSFMFECKEERHVLAYTDYGQTVTAIIARDNMIGMQFHPEKSQANGLQLVAGFLKWKP